MMFYGELTSNWVITFGLMLTVLACFYGGKKVFLSRFPIKKREKYSFFVEMLLKTNLFFLAALTLYFCLPLLPNELTPLISKILLIASMVQVGIWVNHLLYHFIDRLQVKGEGSHGIPAAAKNLLKVIGQGLVWIILFLFLLDNLNFDVATLIAGLGIGGIAVALAVQNILGDVLASLSIIVDKPFAVGDFIIVDNFLGSVQHIGIKTTRLKSLSGEQIIISNSDLLKSRLRNYKRMEERRVLFDLFVPLETPADKLETVVPMLKEIIESTAEVRLDRAHFKKIDTYAYSFEVVYHVLSRDYTLYMDVQQKINLQIVRAFAKNEIEIAYPTQKKI